MTALVSRPVRNNDATTANSRRANSELIIVSVGRLELVDSLSRRVYSSTTRADLFVIFVAWILELSFEQQKVDDFFCIVFFVEERFDQLFLVLETT